MKHLFKIFILFIAFQFSQAPVLAQTQIKNQQEARKLLAQAKEEMAAQDFHAANRSFRHMLDLKVALPTEMCYFFANTLYMLGQFENSLRFAEKYESLAGTGGEYYQDTQKLKALLKLENEKIRSCNICSNQGYVLSECHYCEGQGELHQSCLKCYGKKHTRCKSCEGEGLIIERDHFGRNNYQTCSNCLGKGFQLCPYCDGQGEKTQGCHVCGGNGKVSGSEICKHPSASLEGK